MPEKPKKLGRQNYDWESIKQDYVTDPQSSIRKISDKYGIRAKTVANKSKADNWFATKKQYQKRVATKALTKAATKDANRMARLLDVTDKLTEQIEKVLADPEQLYRQFVPETVSENGTTISTFVDKKSEKFDSKAAKDMLQSLKMIEELNRSLKSIQKAEALHRQNIENERLKLERERFEFEKSKYNDSQTVDNDIKVVIGGYEDGWDE